MPVGGPYVKSGFGCVEDLVIFALSGIGNSHGRGRRKNEAGSMVQQLRSRGVITVECYELRIRNDVSAGFIVPHKDYLTREQAWALPFAKRS